MNKEKSKKNKKSRIIKRVRSKVSGSENRPRLYVFKSNKHIYAGIAVDTDKKSKTLLSVSDKGLDLSNKKTNRAIELGKLIAEKAKQKGITQVVFDKRCYKYHGIVKNIADGARNNGLKF